MTDARTSPARPAIDPTREVVAMRTPPAFAQPARRRDGLSMAEIVALVLSLVWLGLVGWFFLTLDADQVRMTQADPVGFIMTVLGVLLPVALIWVAAAAARTARAMR
ncbi:MAG: hypothetical protein WBA67_17370, partial [Jannaschia sp.]